MADAIPILRGLKEASIAMGCHQDIPVAYRP